MTRKGENYESTGSFEQGHLPWREASYVGPRNMTGPHTRGVRAAEEEAASGSYWSGRNKLKAQLLSSIFLVKRPGSSRVPKLPMLKGEPGTSATLLRKKCQPLAAPENR